MKPARLLIVEDEVIVVADLEIRLAQLGYEVVGSAARGEEAMAMAAALLPDLVLMDIHLQGAMDGVEVAHELRDGLRIPVVFLTAHSEDHTFQHAIEAEPMGYIIKPIEDRELRVAIEMGLYKHQAERKLQASEESLCQAAADLHSLSARLQVVREVECASLSRDLHDSLGQQLTALQIGLMWMDRHLQTAKPPDLAELYDRIVAMVPVVERLIEKTQTVCASLRSAVLDDLGLVAALEWVVKDMASRIDIGYVLSLPGDDEIEVCPDIALALFRITQEALTNVVRHARATQVKLRMLAVGNGLELVIEDNGLGFEVRPRLGPMALGLLGMRERAIGFGGTVEFSSEPGTGTCVRVWVPSVMPPLQTEEHL